MPRKPRNKQYFTKDTENAIIEYNTTDDKLSKDKKRQVYKYCTLLHDKLSIDVPKKKPWYKFW